MTRGARGHHSGLAAEEIALRHYLSHTEGISLLARRWRCPEGEIDLVLEGADGLIFAEVKARPSLERAARSVSPAQWRRIGNAAQLYMAEHGISARPCRFDLVMVDGAGRCERIENAASFEGW